MKRKIFAYNGSTLFLRLALLALSIFVIIICGVTLPAVHSGWVEEFPDFAYMKYPVILGLIMSAVAFFLAVFQAMKLLNSVDKNKVFSQGSVNALGVIKYCALVISAVYVLGMPVFYHIAQEEDAPGVVIIGMFFAGTPLVIAVFIAIAQRLLQNAIDIKSENDLTV